MKSIAVEEGESGKAHLLAYLLANCDCSYIPTALFRQPFLSRRRWTDQGNIQTSHRSGDLPPWINEIFKPTDSASEVLAFPWEAVGAEDSNGHQKLVTISGPFIDIFRLGTIKWFLKDEWTFFEVDQEWKADYRSSQSIEDRELFLILLVKLAIRYFPDPFTDIRWESLSLLAKELITSTVLPYLSVIDQVNLATTAGL